MKKPSQLYNKIAGLQIDRKTGKPVLLPPVPSHGLLEALARQKRRQKDS